MELDPLKCECQPQATEVQYSYNTPTKLCSRDVVGRAETADVCDCDRALSGRWHYLYGESLWRPATTAEAWMRRIVVIVTVFDWCCGDQYTVTFSTSFSRYSMNLCNQGNQELQVLRPRNIQLWSYQTTSSIDERNLPIFFGTDLCWFFKGTWRSSFDLSWDREIVITNCGISFSETLRPFCSLYFWPCTKPSRWVWIDSNSVREVAAMIISLSLRTRLYDNVNVPWNSAVVSGRIHL